MNLNRNTETLCTDAFVHWTNRIVSLSLSIFFCSLLLLLLVFFVFLVISLLFLVVCRVSVWVRERERERESIVMMSMMIRMEDAGVLTHLGRKSSDVYLQTGFLRVSMCVFVHCCDENVFFFLLIDRWKRKTKYDLRWTSSQLFSFFFDSPITDGICSNDDDPIKRSHGLLFLVSQTHSAVCFSSATDSWQGHSRMHIWSVQRSDHQIGRKRQAKTLSRWMRIILNRFLEGEKNSQRYIICSLNACETTYQLSAFLKIHWNSRPYFRMNLMEWQRI